MRKKLLLLALVLLLSIASSAVKIEVWIVGWSNEHERTAENLIDLEFTPITGIEVDILPLGWEMVTKSFCHHFRRCPDIIIQRC